LELPIAIPENLFNADVELFLIKSLKKGTSFLKRYQNNKILMKRSKSYSKKQKLAIKRLRNLLSKEVEFYSQITQIIKMNKRFFFFIVM